MKNQNRYYLLDTIRGLAVINMIIYHAVWDLVYLFDFDWQWAYSDWTYIWQQCICITFIMLSGFCVSLSRHRLKNAVVVLLCGGLVYMTTAIFDPQNPVFFGVLTLIGSCMLASIPFEKMIKNSNPYIGIVGCLGLFVLLRRLDSGYIACFKLPKALYRNMATAYLGFPPINFHSPDYFPLLPWVFIFGFGMFLYSLFESKNWLNILKKPRFGVLEYIGRNSLAIYLIHQPVLYLLFLWLNNGH